MNPFSLLVTKVAIAAIAMSTMVDASNALERIREVFTAELITESLRVDLSLTDAICVEKASFTWDAASPPTSDDTTKTADKSEKKEGNEKGKGEKEKKKGKKDQNKDDAPPLAEPAKEEAVFELKDVDFHVARGKLVAVVGAVGSGKSSLLQALIGEMRRTSGSVTFGGSIAYCSQVPWIQVRTFSARSRYVVHTSLSERQHPRQHLLWSPFRG